jgi:PEP-CTERM motif
MTMTSFRRLLLACAAGILSLSASAYPGLQLGILGATYDTGDETSVAQTPKFKLYAFLTPKGGTNATELSALLADTYYVSAALAPQVSVPSNLGSFTFKDGATLSTIAATSNMVYGTPPLDAALTGGDQLATHGIFPTYFKEFSFQFKATDRVAKVDVQTNPSLTGVTFGTTGDAYYHEFEVDVGELRTYLHFDLYNTELRTCGQKNNPEPCPTSVYDLEQSNYSFAPFSHDAESGTKNPNGGGGGGGGQAPEPASLLLVMLALGALGWQSRAQRRRSGR